MQLCSSQFRTTIAQNMDIRQAVTNLATSSNQPILTLSISEELSIQHFLQVRSEINSQKFTNLSLLVHSGGGDINVSYQIVQLLRKHCKKLNLIVPIYAKSAATLFPMAADEIIMGEFAEFGPLDPQIPEKQGTGMRYSSALNPFKSLEQLQRFSIETIIPTAVVLVQTAKLPVEDAIQQSLLFACNLSSPLYTKLDIEKLGEYSRALEVAKQYGERLLKRYSQKTPEQRSDLLNQLVHNYPSHDYIIDYEEMKDLGLPVRLPVANESQAFEEVIQELMKLKTTTIFLQQPQPVQTPQAQTIGSQTKQK